MKKKPVVFTWIYLTLLLLCACMILLFQFVIPREYEPVQQRVVSPEPAKLTAVPLSGEAAASPQEPVSGSEAPVSETEAAAETPLPSSEAENPVSETQAAAEIPVPSPEAENPVSETQAAAEIPVPSSEAESPVSEPQITLSQMRLFDTNVHIADVRIPDASYLKTALANDAYGRNIKQTVAEMAEANDALLAINGDYFGFRSSGYVIRGGVLYRDRIYDSEQEDLCIWPDGSMTVIRETEVSAQQLMDQGVQDVLSFGPALVLNGEVRVSESLAIGPYSDDNPRTAIGIIEPLHYLFVVSDGRTDKDKGLTPFQLAELMRDLGAQLVYNLDGGGSSTMVYEGEIINFPTARGYYEERRVSDIVYIAR